MFQLKKRFTFEAGHALTYHEGKCKKPHGHSYVFLVKISGTTLQKQGPQKNMIIDFFTIQNIVKPMIETYLDHQWLNDTLETDSPTAEFIAQWIYKHLKPQIPQLTAITLYETQSCSVTYSEENS